MLCPDCDAEVIPGQDECLGCGSDLTGFRVPPPRQGRINERILEDPLSQLNAPRPILLRKEESVLRAVELMRQHRYGSVLVVDEHDKLCGIFTERDLLNLSDSSRGRGGLETVRLETAMTANPETLRDQDTIAHALHRMSVGGFRHVPILRDGVPVAFSSIRGILAYIAINAL